MIDLLRPVARMFYFVRAGAARSRDPRDLVGHSHLRQCPALLAGTVDRGIRQAIGENGGRDPILITGSHYVVGEAMQALHVTV